MELFEALNRNPNWTDSEITRFLSILMEEPVLHDLNAQRNKQVACYLTLRRTTAESSDEVLNTPCRCSAT